MSQLGPGLACLACLGSVTAWAQDPPPVEDTAAGAEDPVVEEPVEEDPWGDLGSFSRPAPPPSTMTRGPDRTMAVPDIDTPEVGSTSVSTHDLFAPTVALDAIDDREEFEQTMGANFASFKACYAGVAVEDLGGRIELRWSVEDGVVTDAAVVTNTTGNSPVGDCIIERIRGWSFPQNFEQELTYSLEFHTGR